MSLPASVREESTKAAIIESNFGRKKGYSRSTAGTSKSFRSDGSGSPYASIAGNEHEIHSPVDGEADHSYPATEGGIDSRRPSALEAHTELVHDIHKDIRSFFSSSVLSTYMSNWSKGFLALVGVAVILNAIFGGILLAEVYQRTITVAVEDGSMCNGVWYEDPKSSTLWYNVALIFVANIFMIWYALRGVTLEKWGTAVCYIIAALTSVARIIYTISGGLLEAYKVPADKRAACVGGLITAAVVTIISLGLLFQAQRGFGWRNYVKGATTREQVSQMNRYQVMDLFLKLDKMLCVHTVVSLFFAVENTAMFIISSVVIAVTVGMLVLITYFIKKQITWFVYAFVAMCPAMPILYVYLIIAQLVVEDSRCFTNTLLPCLSGGNITIEVANYTDVNVSAHTIPAPAGSDEDLWFLLPEGCVPSVTACGNSSVSAMTQCCQEYGQCQYTHEFVRTDQVLLIMLAVAGVVVRVFTMLFSYKRLKEMDIPSIRELFERGDRNMRSFALTFIRKEGKRQGKPSSSASDAPVIAMEEEDDEGDVETTGGEGELDVGWVSK